MAETTHLICAHCGADNSISNWHESDGTLEIIRIAGVLTLLFKCQNCKSEYRLTVLEFMMHNAKLNDEKITEAKVKTITKSKIIKTLQIQHAETGAIARKERQAQFISLRKMARRLNINASYLSYLERGKRNWRMDIIRTYEMALK